MHSCQNWAQNLFALIVHIIVSIIFSLQLSPPILDAKVVAEWLTSKQHSTSDTRQLILVNRWDLEHLVSKPDSYISFAVGQSGWIGVMCFENGLNQGKPSWMHPSKDKPSPDEPTSGQYSGCPVFVTADKEYMAIYDKHKIIHTWYLENNTQRVVFYFKSKSATPTKPKNLCVIDDNTVALGDVYPATDGTTKVFMFETGVKKWTLRNILTLTTNVQAIPDMCFVKTLDGTPCLVLSCPLDGYLQAMELIGGRMKWQTGRQQKGLGFLPLSICAGRNNTLYVTDPDQCKLYLLSTDDGAVIDSVNLSQYDIVCPVSVRARGEHVHIAHRRAKEKNKWQISSFTIDEREIVSTSHL